jgi:hypothetical protein
MYGCPVPSISSLRGIEIHSTITHMKWLVHWVLHFSECLVLIFFVMFVHLCKSTV